MNPNNIEELARTLNNRADAYDIGSLQDIRAKIHDKRRAWSDIFPDQTIFDDYAYHWGGRTEPQFNVSRRMYGGELKIRYGIGISLQDSRSAPNMLETMQPKIHLFNEYLSSNPEQFSEMKLWYEPKDSTVPEGDYPASPIPESFVEEENFIFLGKRKKPSEISYDDILTLFDRLLPLYEYIERNVAEESYAPDSITPLPQAAEGGLYQLPEEETEPETHEEGSTATVEVNRYERSQAARRACLEHYGAECQVCGLRFEERYGEIGEGFIEVHHEVPLSETSDTVEVDPIEDMKPVCPNCHAMLHRKSPPFSIEELKGRLRSES